MSKALVLEPEKMMSHQSQLLLISEEETNTQKNLVDSGSMVAGGSLRTEGGSEHCKSKSDFFSLPSTDSLYVGLGLQSKTPIAPMGLLWKLVNGFRVYRYDSTPSIVVRRTFVRTYNLAKFF